MINCHRTADCPACGKDSWQSEQAAYFTVVKCTWCGALFTYDDKTKSFKVTDKRGTK